MSKKIACLCLALFFLLLVLPGMWALPVLDRDEAHFAQATRQMLQTGNYFQIRFQEQTRFQKPPGINWLQSLSVAAFSNKDAALIWPYRLPSLVMGLLALLASLYLFSSIAGSSAAFWASVFLATSLLLTLESQLAVIDASLLLSVVLMQAALWQIYRGEIGSKTAALLWPLLFWLALSLGFLLKGVTPLFALGSLIALGLADKRWLWMRQLYPLSGLLLFFSLSLAWLYCVNQAEQSNYLLQMFKKDLLPKLQAGHESHGAPPFFHFSALLLTFWPASLFLWQGLCFGYAQRQQQAIRFLLAWIVPSWLFFELMPTKLPQYLLPLFPALALLAALAIRENTVGRQSLLLRGLQLLWLLASLVLLGLLYALTWHFALSLSLWARLGFLLLLMTILLSFTFAYQGAYARAARLMPILALLTYPLMFGSIFPALQELWLSQQIARYMDTKPQYQRWPIWALDYQEPSLVFYQNTAAVRYIAEDQLALAWNLKQPHLLLLSSERRLPARAKILQEFKGFNYSRGRQQRLRLVLPSLGGQE